MDDITSKLILASNSPRRKELLTKIVPEFLVVPSKFDEKIKKGMTPYHYVLSCARGKALDVFEKNKDSIILAADTIVVTKNDKILLKPQDDDEAFNMLKELSGDWHSVMTSVCVKTAEKAILKCQKSYVRFWQLNDEDIKEYVATGLPFDKAGAYGIQDEWTKERVWKIRKGEDNIMGLPLKLTKKMLEGLI